MGSMFEEEAERSRKLSGVNIGGWFGSRGSSSSSSASPSSRDAEEEEVPEPHPHEEPQKPPCSLSEPAFLQKEGLFLDKAPISVLLHLTPEHKTRKRVEFELYAKTPKGLELLHRCDTLAEKKEGAQDSDPLIAKTSLPLYIPSYRTQDGVLMEKAEMFFKALHPLCETVSCEASPLIASGKAEFFLDSNVLEDVTFDTDKSFIRPEMAPKLYGLRKTIQVWKKEHPEGKVALLGHADKVGSEEHNKALSERRARSVLSFLLSGVEDWVALSKEEKWGVKSEQSILSFLGYPVGKVDGVYGEKMKGALLSFQKDKGLPESGKVEEGTQKALYAALMEEKTEGAGEEEEKPLRGSDFIQIDGQYFMGCSEFNTLNGQEGASEENRRVTAVLLKHSKEIALPFPCRHKNLGPCRGQVNKLKGQRNKPSYLCHFYDSIVKEEKKGGGGDIPPKPAEDTEIEWLSPKLADPAKAEHRQYVNLKTGDAAGDNEGSDCLLKVKLAKPGSFKTLYWKIEAEKGNSKRSDPLPGLVHPSTKKVTAIKAGTAEIETPVEGGEGSVFARLGLAGGDVFVVKVGVKPGEWKKEITITNWRKLWFQLTHHEDLTPPSMKTAQEKLKEVFVEWEADAPEKHKLAKNGEVTVGNHNAADYHKLLKSKHAGQCCHIILCDKQYDGLSGGKNITIDSDASFKSANGPLTASNRKKNLVVPNPPVQKGAALLLAATWSNAIEKTKGTLTDDPAKLDDNTGLATWIDEDTFEIDLPKNAKPGDTMPVKVNMTVTGASGPWGGDGGTAPHNLVVLNPNDTLHTQCVLHELGHLMNMVPLSGYFKAPPGFTLANHQLKYDKMGGSGSHCSFEIDKAKSTATLNVDGKCIMFHQLNKNCKLIYCPDCAPFVKAQSLLGFQDLKG